MVVVGRQLGFDPLKNGLFFRKSIWAQLGEVGRVGGDLWTLREQIVTLVVKALVGVGADNIRRSAVRVVSGVAFLTVWHRQVLWAERGQGLALGHAHGTPVNGKRTETSLIPPSWHPRWCTGTVIMLVANIFTWPHANGAWMHVTLKIRPCVFYKCVCDKTGTLTVSLVTPLHCPPLLLLPLKTLHVSGDKMCRQNGTDYKKLKLCSTSKRRKSQHHFTILGQNLTHFGLTWLRVTAAL